MDECFGQLINIVKSPDTPLSHNEPAKRTSTKKKKKKVKSKAFLLLDNNIASETVDMSTISNRTDLVDFDLGDAASCNDTAIEVISKSVHDKASESTLNSDRSNHFLGAAYTECLTSIKKSGVENTALQDLALMNKKVHGTHKMKFVQCSSTMTIFSCSEPVSVSLKNVGDNGRNSASTASPFLDKCTSPETCEKGSNRCCFEMERSDITQNEVTADIDSCFRPFMVDSSACCPGIVNPSFGANNADNNRLDISASIPIHGSLGVKEDGKIDCNMEVTPGNQCSWVCHVHAVEPIQNSGWNKRHSQISQGPSWALCCMNNEKKFGKENANLTWQRTGRYIGSPQTDAGKTPNHNCLNVDATSTDATSLSNHKPSEGDGLLPPSHFHHYSKDGFQQKAKYSGISSQKMYRTQGQMLVGRGDIQARHSQHVSRMRKDGFRENSSWDSLENKLTPHFKHDNANPGRKGLWVSKPNMCKPGTRKAFLNEIKPNDVATSKSIYVSSFDEDKSSVCSGIDLPSHSTMREFNSRLSSHKWVAVDKKDSQMLKNSRDNRDITTREVNHHQEVDNEALHLSSSVLDITKDAGKYDGLTTGGPRSVREDKNDYRLAFDYIAENLPVYICSDLAWKTLTASYILQIVSESFQLATGSPIAEFEKLLYSASPVVAPSVIQQHSVNMAKHEPLSALFSKFQNPGIALTDLWNWYEGPGNFGLQVKAEDSQNSKRSEANVSFYAHFVPFLSAVQLFGCPYHPFGISSENTEDCSSLSSFAGISSVDSLAETSSSDCISSKKRMIPGDIAASISRGCSPSASSVCQSDDSHLIFEYFEHEPPQQRKPLFAKIKELLQFGTSSSQIYGDPSKLESMNLQDLHPASWYSVAWYPIYRIPEGCFRASFLTYHSLGHLHLRCTKLASVQENAYWLVSPALGMQSYNAQGECWLYPKKPADHLRKESKVLDASELLKERIRTLEETAALFSRGRVHKDRITVGNRHPDYEFFLSRKH